MNVRGDGAMVTLFKRSFKAFRATFKAFRVSGEPWFTPLTPELAEVEAELLTIRDRTNGLHAAAVHEVAVAGNHLNIWRCMNRACPGYYLDRVIDTSRSPACRECRNTLYLVGKTYGRT